MEFARIREQPMMLVVVNLGNRLICSMSKDVGLGSLGIVGDLWSL